MSAAQAVVKITATIVLDPNVSPTATIAQTMKHVRDELSFYHLHLQKGLGEIVEHKAEFEIVKLFLEG